jgi:hypothetical protein
MKKLMGFAMILVISGNALAGTVPAKGNNATIVIGKSIGSVPWPRNSRLRIRMRWYFGKVSLATL